MQETKSGREDLNLRPHGPEPCALTELRYAPNKNIIPLLLQLYKHQKMGYNGTRNVPL
jgi:hypothetical protein